MSMLLKNPQECVDVNSVNRFYILTVVCCEERLELGFLTAEKCQVECDVAKNRVRKH